MPASRTVSTLGLITAATLLLAACGATGSTDAPDATDTEAPSFEYESPTPVVRAPLTGLETDADTALTASLAAKIDNHPEARPQIGVERADVVIEELVEGGLTRYVAVWHSDVPELIGPVRSIRPMDPDIVGPYGGIIAYSGGQPQFVSMMQAAPVINAIHGGQFDGGAFARDASRIAPHNVVVSAQELVAQHPDAEPPAVQYSFADDSATATASLDGEPASQLNLVFGQASNQSWDWDEESGRWLRSQAGVPDFSASGERLGAENLVVLRVPVSFGLGVPKTELIGGGEALVASGGRILPASWSKNERDGRIRIVDEQGALIRLAPGQSWVSLVPLSGAVSAVEVEAQPTP